MPRKLYAADPRLWKVVQIQVTVEEHLALTLEASEAGISVSDLLRIKCQLSSELEIREKASKKIDKRRGANDKFHNA